MSTYADIGQEILDSCGPEGGNSDQIISKMSPIESAVCLLAFMSGHVEDLRHAIIDWHDNKGDWQVDDAHLQWAQGHMRDQWSYARLMHELIDAMSVRGIRILKSSRVTSFSEITRERMLMVRGCGKKTADEIMEQKERVEAKERQGEAQS